MNEYRKQILEMLQEYSEKLPHWRIGQIIANAVRAYDGRLNCDPFYMSDDELLEGLKKLDEYLK